MIYLSDVKIEMKRKRHLFCNCVARKPVVVPGCDGSENVGIYILDGSSCSVRADICDDFCEFMYEWQ